MFLGSNDVSSLNADGYFRYLGKSCDAGPCYVRRVYLLADCPSRKPNRPALHGRKELDHLQTNHKDLQLTGKQEPDRLTRTLIETCLFAAGSFEKGQNFP